MGRTIVKWVGAVLGMLVLAGGTLAVSFRDIIRGPGLEPTPAELSLRGEFPPPEGWAESDHAAAMEYASSAGAAAVIVIQAGQTVAEWGETDLRSSVHSVRKSVLSALYGVAVDRGLIDIDRTLAELRVEEVGRPLTATERTATLRHLLTATSGIYHASVKDDNGPYPEPGTHEPGEAFVYNNWSFNAAGILFEELTGLSMGAAFHEWIAVPIGMQDFRPDDDVRYTEGPESRFPAWRFWMSTRDMARFGQLYMQLGAWNGRQVVSAEWVRESLAPAVQLDNGTGYGYLWWTMPDGSAMATGTGGQKIRLYPSSQTVIATKVNTGSGLSRRVWFITGPRIGNGDLARILELLGVE